MRERNRLPRSLTLKSRLEISDLLDKGRRYSADSFTLIWLPGEDFKYCVLLSRRFGLANRRVRIKRLFREAIRLNRHRLERTGKLAILPRPGKETPGVKALMADVGRIFDTINKSN